MSQSTRATSSRGRKLTLPNVSRDSNSNRGNKSVDGGSGISEDNKAMVEYIIEYITDLMTEKLDAAIKEIVSKYEERDREVQQLKDEVTSLKNDLGEMTERLEDLESQGRSDNIIISGGALPETKAGENPVEVSSSVLRDKLKYICHPDEIVDAYRVGKRSSTQVPDRRSLVMKLRSRDVKRDVLKAARTVKPDSLYFRESLIPSRSTVLYALRRARRRCPDKIAAVGSMDGRVYLWLILPDPSARNKKIFINNRHQLNHLCDKSLGFPASELLDGESRD